MESEQSEVPARIGRTLAVHALAYLVLLLALLALTDRQVGWNLDDGAYATQVRVLEQTDGWAYPYLHADIDPGSDFGPLYLSTATDEASYPYTKLPAWIHVLRGSVALFGEPIGLYVPSVVGAVLAALAGGWLAERLARGSAVLGFWAVALGPLVVHTQALWAHTVAAAVGGAGALVVVAVAQRRERRSHLVVLALALAGLVAVRTDGLLLAVALGLVLGGLFALRPGSATGRLLTAAVWAGTPVVTALAVRLGSSAWTRQLSSGQGVGEPNTSDPGSTYLTGRITGALRTVIDGVGASEVGTALALLGLVLAVAGGLVVARRPDRTTDGWLLAGLGVGIVVLRTVVVAPDDLGGLLVAVPLVAVAVGTWRWSSAQPAARALAAVAALYGAAVLVTQYPEGGSRDWGGRFLFPILVPLVVGAVLVLRPRIPVASPRQALAVLLLAAAVPTAAGLVVADRARGSNRDFAAALATGDDAAPTVIGLPRYLVRVDWLALPERDRLAADVDTVEDLLARLRPGRTEPVAVVGHGADDVRAPGWRRDLRSPILAVLYPS